MKTTTRSTTGTYRGFHYTIERHDEMDCSKWLAQIELIPGDGGWGEPCKLTYSNDPELLVFAYIDGIIYGRGHNGGTE